MMKKRFIPFILTILLCSCHRDRIKTGLEGKLLPSFSLTLADSVTTFNTDKIAEGKSFVIFYYQPYCPYCRAQTEEIIKNINKFNRSDIYMISSWPYQDVQKFAAHYNLSKYPNITVISDRKNELKTYFQSTGVPFLAFYDKQRKLKEADLGKQDIDILESNLSE